MSSCHHNPLHLPVPPSQRSGFSTLNLPNLPVHETPSPNEHSRATTCRGTRLVHQTSYAPSASSPSGKWNYVDGPQLLQSPITFDYVGCQDQGVPLDALLARGDYAIGERLQGADDTVLAHTKVRKITLRIRWPGYYERTGSIAIKTPRGKPFTREQLGFAIAQEFVRFVNQVQDEPTTLPDWKLGPGHIDLNRITLRSLQNVSWDTWEADVSISPLGFS